jgi:hypothetical protein
MRRFLLIAIIMALGLHVSAQDSFTFKNKSVKIEADYGMASTHYLGPEIANKMYLFKQTYTYVEAGTPMSPGDKVIVQKPTIFYAVRKLDKHYKKLMKKGTITESEAREKMGRILDISYIIFDQDTGEFETYLKKMKGGEQIEEAFDKIELI